MAISSKRWNEIAPSSFQWEIEALEYIKNFLPDHDPYRAWSNFEFIAHDGSINEVDLLVLTACGFFLVEIKSRPGHLKGDVHTWVWKDDIGKMITTDNPIFLANKKAKRLVSLLTSQKALKKEQCPFLEAIIFCSAENLTWDLKGRSAYNICFRDKTTGKTPGIRDALMNRNIPGLRQNVPSITKPQSKAIGRAIDQAQIRPSQHAHKVGDYKLEKLIFQCPKNTYQDWKASHVNLKSIKRRVRVYHLALKESKERRILIENAAKKEFHLLEKIQHEGIVHAENYTVIQQGPALIYKYNEDEIRLDQYLKQYTKIGIDTRLALVRQIAESIKFAHGKRIIHRSLCPQCILVSDVEKVIPKVKILNWHAGKKLTETTYTELQTENITVCPDQLMEDISLLYMSPESLRNPETSNESVDIFSLGAISYHIFSGAPPASTLMELDKILRDNKGLDISLVRDGSGRELSDLIKGSTCPDILNRFETIDEFLEQFELVEFEFTEPENHYIENPLDAKENDQLKDNYIVKKRLGKGGSATVFLVKDPQGKEVVYKLSNKPDFNNRLEAEFECLKDLRHQQIVEVFHKNENNGLCYFTMQLAGQKTLAQRLREEGRLQLEFLKRFGKDLLQILIYLEDRGKYHRDIKPENIGISPFGNNKKLRLFLFDFSLASIPLDNIRVGTIKYHDPYLSRRSPSRWDAYAERFLATMTLYEMATATLPVWGDGESSPDLNDFEVTVESEFFDTNIRTAMSSFFEKAFKPDHKKRFDNAEDMLNAWDNIFSNIDKQTIITSHQDSTIDQKTAIAKSELETQMISLGLSPQANSALEKMNVITVKDLLDIPFNEFRQMRGVGNNTRKEIIKISHDLHRTYPDFKIQSKATDHMPPADPHLASIDTLTKLIQKTGNIEDKKIIHTFLGFPLDNNNTIWPERADIEKHNHINHKKLINALENARNVWKKIPAITKLRDEIAELLQRTCGVMHIQDMASALLSLRGSVLDRQKERTLSAIAVCRAALETERLLKNQRFIDYRGENGIFIAIHREAADYAEKLGKAADKIACMEPILSPNKSSEILRKISPPKDITHHINDHYLFKLAVSASSKAALSSRLEIYPKKMSSLRMIRLSQGVLTGQKELTIQDIHNRVNARFPEGECLPKEKKQMDPLFENLGMDLIWNPTAAQGKGAYCHKLNEITVLNTSSTAATTIENETSKWSNQDTNIHIFDRKILKAEQECAFLVLSVHPRRLSHANEALKSRFDLDFIDFDSLFIPILKKEAQRLDIQWDVIIRADAASHDSKDWKNLQKLVQRCIPEINKKLSLYQKTILLTGIGLIARYNLMHILENFRDRSREASNHLKGFWILVPASERNQLPTINGIPVPILGSSQHLRIPAKWIKKMAQKP